MTSRAGEHEYYREQVPISPILAAVPHILDLDDPRWLAFVESFPGTATLFHHPVWAGLLEECYGYRPFVASVLDRAGRLIAGVPLMDVRSPLTGRRWIALPFSDHCAPLARDEAALRQLTAGLIALQRRGDAPRLEIHAQLPESQGLFLQCKEVHHQRPLTTEHEVLFNSFKPMVRRAIRKATREGVVAIRAESPADMEAFYSLHVQNRHRLGAPVQPRRFFRLLWDRIIAPGYGFLLLACKDNVPISGAIFLAWNGVLMDKYIAADQAYLSVRPNNLLVWAGMRWGCEHGYTTFDFGKTDLSNSGLREYKLGWGMTETALVYSTIAGAPPARGTGRMDRLLSATIRNSSPLVGRAIGELLYGHFA